MRSTRARYAFAAAAALAAAAFVSGAQAQGRLSLAERMQRLEAQVQGQGAGQSSVELMNRLNELQQEVQSLRGLVEQQAYEIENLKKAQRDRYVDLDSRLSRLEGGSPSASLEPSAPPLASIDPATLEAPAPTAPGQLMAEEPEVEPRDEPALAAEPAAPALDASYVDPGAEKAAYDEAFAALRDGRYAESARRFQGFLQEFPNGDLTDNAMYWLGESYYVTQNYRPALETFSDLSRRYPQSSKAPDSLLKIGYAHYELREWPQAEQALTAVVTKYPDTTVARLAQGRLRALRLEGQR
ncbi:MAG TPA: tol-pal system protein YbgF [Candidatus Saccharimonadia bacterium]|nr:tol-pal system protein YbgF [Candidatus Saccharimonadia bacterium]